MRSVKFRVRRPRTLDIALTGPRMAPDLQEEAMTHPPNILFIMVDQMRWDCLSVLGHPVVETPHLDELGRQGVIFTSAFSPCPSCIAARASVFTGLSPSSHGRLGYRDEVPWRYRDTLVERFAAAGYQTHCVGKTHFFPQRLALGFGGLESYEAEQNFGAGYINDYYAWLAQQTAGRVTERDSGAQCNSWVARPSHLPEELHNNTWVATRSMEYLRRLDPTRPFFLFMSFHRPHPPIDPPKAFWDMYADRPVPAPHIGGWAAEHDVPVAGVNAWRGRLPAETLARSRRAYCAQIAHIDFQIGRVMNEMRRHVRPGPTWVVFTSDHGEMLGDHHLFRKSYAYQGSAGVPMIIVPPEGTKGGESTALDTASGARSHECRAAVTLTDLFPTMLDAAGLPVPATCEGRSLLPLMRGEARLAGREFVHGEHSRTFAPAQDNQYLTDGREKYVWFPFDGREQLFDLANDPGETRDLSSDKASRQRLELWRSRMVEQLAPREADGLSDGKRLISGKTLPAARPELLAP